MSYITNTNGFTLNVKLHDPQYLGGLDKNGILYDLYVGDSGSANSPRYMQTVNSSNNITVDLTSKILINGLYSIKNLFYLSVQLIIKDENLAGIASLPPGSPTLTIELMCDLFG